MRKGFRGWSYTENNIPLKVKKQPSQWAKSLLLIRHSKYSAMLSKTQQTAFRTILPTGMYLEYIPSFLLVLKRQLLKNMQLRMRCKIANKDFAFDINILVFFVKLMNLK